MTDLVTILLVAWAGLVVLDLFLLALIVHGLPKARRLAPESEEPPGLRIS